MTESDGKESEKDLKMLGCWISRGKKGQRSIFERVNTVLLPLGAISKPLSFLLRMVKLYKRQSLLKELSFTSFFKVSFTPYSRCSKNVETSSQKEFVPLKIRKTAYI